MPFVTISFIGAFGLVSVTMLITLNVSSTYFDVYTFIVQNLLSKQNQLKDTKEDGLGTANEDKDEISMLGRHWTRSFFWIPKHVFDINIKFERIDRANDIPIPSDTDKILLFVDNRVRNSLSDTEFLSSVKKYYYYFAITPIDTFKDTTTKYDISTYPFASLSENHDVNWVQIRGHNILK
jgi:hypothetical protein